MATISERLEYFSDWHRAKRAVAACTKLIAPLQHSSKEPLHGGKKTSKEKQTTIYQSLSVDEMRKAEQAVLKSVQEEAFSKEIKILKSLGVSNDNTSRESSRRRNSSMKKTSSLYRLDPFIDEHGVLRVGGRIRNSSISYDVQHPVNLPSKGHVTMLLETSPRKDKSPRPRNYTERSAFTWILDNWRKLISFPIHLQMRDLP